MAKHKALGFPILAQMQREFPFCFHGLVPQLNRIGITT
jgi:hypothetical protein